MNLVDYIDTGEVTMGLIKSREKLWELRFKGPGVSSDMLQYVDKIVTIVLYSGKYFCIKEDHNKYNWTSWMFERIWSL